MHKVDQDGYLDANTASLGFHGLQLLVIAIDQNHPSVPLVRISLERFFERFRKYGFPVTRVGTIEDLEALPDLLAATTAAVVIEPVIQGVNEMRPWPDGMLRRCQRFQSASISKWLRGRARTSSMIKAIRKPNE